MDIFALDHHLAETQRTSVSSAGLGRRVESEDKILFEEKYFSLTSHKHKLRHDLRSSAVAGEVRE